MKALGIIAIPLILALAASVLVLNAKPPTPTYVIGGQGADEAYWLVLVECSAQPTSWRTAEAYCDMGHVRAISVDSETYAVYSQGDKYP